VRTGDPLRLTGRLLTRPDAYLRTTRCALLIGALLALAGCNGGTVDRHALTNDASTLDSIACEGALLAHDASKGASTRYFVRVQADHLRAQASHLADALAERPTSPGIEKRVRAKAKDASAIASVLSRLHHHAGDREVAARAERALTRAGKCP
jgi:predicted outer membrane protein